MKFFIAEVIFVTAAIISETLGTPLTQDLLLDPVTTDDILSGRLLPKSLDAEWMKGNDNQMRIELDDCIILYNVKNGETREILNLTKIEQQLPDGSSLQSLIYTDDGRYALVQHQNPDFLHKEPPEAKYDILDIQSQELISKLNPSGWNNSEEQANLQAVLWSPIGNTVAFVYNFNIYYLPDVTSSSEEVWQITQDGQDTETLAIYNGVPDWSYDMEDAMWFSKHGYSLTYLKFNETGVSQFQWPMYGKPGDENGIYPEWKKMRYAKAGTPNARVTLNLNVVDFAEDGFSLPKTLDLNLKQRFDEDPYIIGKAFAINEVGTVVAALPRNQTSLSWFVCQEGGDGCDEIQRMEEKNGWIDASNTMSPTPSKMGDSFLYYESIYQNEEIGSYMQIVRTYLRSGRRTVITEGKLYVDRVLGWDEDRNRIYFQGTFWNGTAADPSEMQVYSVSDDGVNRDLTCLTRELTNAMGEKCRKNTAKFSADFTYFIHYCEGPGTPMTTTRLTFDGRQVDNPGPSLVTNSELQAFLDTKAHPMIKEYLVPVGNESLGFNARVRLYFPPNANEGEKYPLLLYLYPGPFPIIVDQAYFYENFGWHSTLPSSSNVILAIVDGRGTQMQSSQFQFQAYKKLGTVEMDDQIKVTKWLTENEPLIDKENIAAFGHSYGGYATIRILERDVEQIFKCGIAMAPVTNWRYYFTRYTERYMGFPTPEDNLQGYLEGDATSPEAIENLRNKTLLLIHGTADYNVHFQNSMIFTRALQQADIMFHEMYYPDEDHDLMKPETQRHLFHTMENFLLHECYRKNN